MEEEDEDVYQSRMDFPPDDVIAALKRQNEQEKNPPRHPRQLSSDTNGVSNQFHEENVEEQHRPLSQGSAISNIVAIDSNDDNVSELGHPAEPQRTASRAITSRCPKKMPRILGPTSARPHILFLLPQLTKTLLKGLVSANKGKTKADVA